MIDCIIIDDEQHAIDLLSRHIQRVDPLNLVATTTDPVQGINLLNGHRGLLFLDVQMPQISGMDILRLIGPEVKVIMTTAYSDYALEGYEHAVFDYLLKPIGFARFLKAVTRLIKAEATVQPPEEIGYEYLFIKTDQRGKLLKVDIASITFIEGCGNYVKVHTESGQQLLAYMNLRDLEIRLQKHSFIRVHKSYIISLQHLHGIEGNMITINHWEQRLPIGRAYREQLFAIMN
jgi:two-component system LytT family response regulator